MTAVGDKRGKEKKEGNRDSKKWFYPSKKGLWGNEKEKNYPRGLQRKKEKEAGGVKKNKQSKTCWFLSRGGRQDLTP